MSNQIEATPPVWVGVAAVNLALALRSLLRAAEAAGLDNSAVAGGRRALRDYAQELREQQVSLARIKSGNNGKANVLQPPALTHDAMMLAQFQQSVSPNGQLERRVVWNLLSRLVTAGFTEFRLNDGEEETACADPQAVMELLFNLDEAHVHTRKPNGKWHWIYIVLGTDTDIVSDYGVPPVDDGFDALMSAFNGEDYA